MRYQRGRNRAVDEAMDTYPAIERLLRQRRNEYDPFDGSVSALTQLVHTPAS